MINQVPVVHWKLLETHEKQIRLILEAEREGESVLAWREEFRVGQEKIDRQHQELFAQASEIRRKLGQGQYQENLSEDMRFLIQYTEDHFEPKKKSCGNTDTPTPNNTNDNTGD